MERTFGYPHGVAGDPDERAAWEQLLAAERHLQALVSGSVLVGGTAAALHLGHRRSLDGDHVVADLRERFDEVLSDLESAAGWDTARVRRPVLILGALDGVLTGIRQLRRTAPLECTEVHGLRVPTLAEMARVKAWLLATRYTVRDYLDTVVLFERVAGEPGGLPTAMARFDDLYRQLSGVSPLGEVVERLVEAGPTDLPQIELASYKGLAAPWTDWTHVVARGRIHARTLAGIVLGEDAP